MSGAANFQDLYGCRAWAGIQAAFSDSKFTVAQELSGAEIFVRSTGKPGVVLVTSGPGVTNIVTGIATAKMDSTSRTFAI